MDPILLLTILLPFYVTFLFLPKWIKKVRKTGLVWQDMNKYDKRKVAGSGGLIVIFSFILAVLFYIALKTFYFKDGWVMVEVFALATSVLILAGVGIIDDLFGWHHGGLSRKFRLLLCLFSAIPLMVINAGVSNISLPFVGQINFGLIYPLIIIPVGMIGATTTYNFLAGFNGLEAGQGILLLTSLGIVTYFTGSSWLALISFCMVSALVAFWLFNKYPAKVFPGDVLTYPIGGLIAMTAILGNCERIAVFFFIPYIAETFLKLRGRLEKHSFGKPEKDGSLKLSYDKIYSLNHIAILFLSKVKKKVREREVVLFVHLIQLAFIILGFVIFKNFIF